MRRTGSRRRWYTGVVSALVVMHGSCATPRPASEASPRAEPPMALSALPGSNVAPAVRLPPSPPADPPPPNPEDVARARALVKRGELLYRSGDYDQAELTLKEAITAYPFLAQANLLLGKIFLVRGAAKRDLGMIHSARLMFEMARALDGSLREAEVLLDLFVAPPLE